MDSNVQIEIYAKYAVYAHNIDPITRKKDFHTPARVIALVASESIARGIVEVCEDGLGFYRELDHTQRIDVEYTPLPFE